mmetsp:Transcript_52526/g.123367  ORF Transcript_52526/g.123367 Transcript_52526/m.123367 type:complete len:210 (-) Transcript_52526:1128-1757(-)
MLLGSDVTPGKIHERFRLVLCQLLLLGLEAKSHPDIYRYRRWCRPNGAQCSIVELRVLTRVNKEGEAIEALLNLSAQADYHVRQEIATLFQHLHPLHETVGPECELGVVLWVDVLKHGGDAFHQFCKAHLSAPHAIKESHEILRIHDRNLQEPQDLNELLVFQGSLQVSQTQLAVAVLIDEQEQASCSEAGKASIFSLDLLQSLLESSR